MLNYRPLPLLKQPAEALQAAAVVAARSKSGPADGDGTDDSFRWANHLALRARIAVSSSLVALASLLHTWPAVRLPLTPLLAVAAFEAVINQPYPLLRRLAGSHERVYLVNLTCDIAAFTVAAYALGSLAEHFLFFVFLFSIALVGATAGRRLAYWTACLGGFSSLSLAALSNRGLLPVLSPAARHVAGSDSGPVVMVHIFCFFLLAFFVSIPATKLRQDIRRRKRVERELRASEAELTHRAFHDPLTGIPNRALFAQHLSHALELAHRQRQTLAVLFLDLDRFKQVNDSLGHTAGDALLVALANRLRSQLRAEDTIARFGGDEFMVLLEHLEHMGDAERVADGLLAALREPFELEGGHEVATSASIGIALATPIATALGASDLLRHADIAVHRAKAAGRACAVTFDGTMNHQVLERVALESDLRHAVPRGQLRVFYQPLLEAHSGRITGAEALVAGNIRNEGS